MQGSIPHEILDYNTADVNRQAVDITSFAKGIKSLSIRRMFTPLRRNSFVAIGTRVFASGELPKARGMV